MIAPSLDFPKSLSFAAACVILYITGLLLTAGRSILIPIVLALLIWHFLNAVHRAICRIPKLGPALPFVCSATLTLIVVSLLAYVLFSIFSNNVTDVIQSAPRYQTRIRDIFEQFNQLIPMQSFIQLPSLFDNWSLQSVLIGVYAVFSSLTSSAILIALYVSFIFVEQHFFIEKLDALCINIKHKEIVHNILKHITQETQLYLGLKTFLNLVVALCSWLIMQSVGLDFSAFWALLIFFLTFIPTIGAMIATVFPALLALIQFQTMLPCIIITSGIVMIQFIIGNLIEPRVLSKSLNMSPLVMLISLAFWGSIWGILGMFLAVPMTGMLLIIFAHFDSTRALAILLSQDGRIQKNYEKI